MYFHCRVPIINDVIPCMTCLGSGSSENRNDYDCLDKISPDIYT